jgi:hypothetical protein
MWEFILAWLAWMSADPDVVRDARPRAAAAVAVARSSMALPPAPPAKAAAAPQQACPTGQCPPAR